MKTKLLIVSAILGVSIYAIADVGIALPPTDDSVTTSTHTRSNTTNSIPATKTNTSISPENVADEKIIDDENNSDSNAQVESLQQNSMPKETSQSSHGSEDANLFDELLKIKAIYETESGQVEQKIQAQARTMNQWNVEAEKRQLELIQKEAELASLERLLEKNRHSLINSLDAYSDDSNNLFNQVQEQLQQQQILANQVDTLKREEKILRTRMNDNLSQLSSVNRELDALVIKTKQNIRSVVEKKLNEPIHIQAERPVQCSLNETLKACMAKPSTKKAIVGPTLYEQFKSDSEQQLFSDLDYSFLDFNYINAYQRMDGETYFKVDAKVLIRSNSQMFANLYNLVGLPETGVYRVILTSNRDATFFINNTNVGKGQAVAVNVERGSYLVRATYQGRSESTKEHITESTSLYYGF